MLMALDNCKEIIARVSEQFTNYSASNLSITEEHFIDHLPEKVSIDSERQIFYYLSSQPITLAIFSSLIRFLISVKK